ncbi:MAG: ABC transporter ATP-binding protein [Chloroflexi bacterium]|nr:ABC transporter ATP-binding protein [Chloroflexota bacterium]
MAEVSYIKIKNVRKEFPPLTAKDRGTLAIRDISLEVDKGRFVSICGPSGCGKSTLLQIVAGLMAGSSGEVWLEKKQITHPPFEMIYVFQQYTKSIFPWKTVHQNVAFGLENREKMDGKVIRKKCEEYIDLVGLTGFENHYSWQLSGGMQQRVAIARALVCQPQVLLMDEPFSSVDALTRSGLQDFLLKIWADFSLTVLFVTHDIEEAIYLSDTVVVLSKAPAVVMDRVAIDLPYPRDQLITKESPRYIQFRHDIFSKVFAEEAEVHKSASAAV